MVIQKQYPATRQIEVLHEFSSKGGGTSPSSGAAAGILMRPDQPTSLLNFVIAELLNTEQSYVRELQSIVDFYMRPFDAPENEPLIASHLRDRSEIIFGNIPDLVGSPFDLLIEIALKIGLN
ncbi:unnamed protein product [Gongylonema pulchrum]|uniref:DH domain-containing protein n=1 Tax=Gongylonema pulchrum TaxID=637853 RepID=A0A183EZX3_9BILA|nr:unnamed protein product [Gongylonema pulchrum]